MITQYEGKLHPECKKMLEEWPKTRERYQQDQLVTKVRNQEIVTELYTENHYPAIKFPESECRSLKIRVKSSAQSHLRRGPPERAVFRN